MDTKLKKSHKLTIVLITLCILLPAFLLVALYPRVREVMHEKEAEYEALNEKLEEELGEEAWTTVWDVEPNFINYAMESAYYLYHTMTDETPNEKIFKDYGWINDYWQFLDNVKFIAEYGSDSADGATQEGNTDNIETEQAVGYLNIEFDSRGYLSEIELDGLVELQLPHDADSLYEQAMKTATQFENNVSAYEEIHEVEIEEQQYVPKNFSMQIAIPEESDFTDSSYTEHTGHYYYSSTTLFIEAGGIVLIVAAAVFVALMALILPLFKKLNTGWEKPFCLPFELLAVLVVGGIGAAYGMYCAMHYTCYETSYPNLEILGVKITDQVWYISLLILNFLGWAILFFAEYVAVSAVRQFLCRPLYYIKKRILCVRIIGWLKKQCVKLYHWVTKIDLSDKLNNSIFKIVLVNFVILTILCAMWFVGLVGVILYSVILFFVLQKYGRKLQKQYNSILKATNQMAEGNLKLTMEKDLGVFQPIGDSLEKVQQGFSKAVTEEAKSQSMKTELITNVSHDLKTPLTAIITYVDLLKREDVTEEERRIYVQTLEQKSQRLKVLIEDLFEVSKAHSGTVKMNFMDVDIVSLLKEVSYEMKDQIESSNLTFRWNLPEEKIVLNLDSQRTYRVFENLFNNALKYALPYSRVYVDVFHTETDVEVMIRNISAQELDFDPERLTERFVRGDASRQSEGSGLGLAIAKSFVELQNGKFHIETDGDLFKVIIAWNK